MTERQTSTKPWSQRNHTADDPEQMLFRCDSCECMSWCVAPELFRCVGCEGETGWVLADLRKHYRAA
jgi:hypothetical protein